MKRSSPLKRKTTLRSKQGFTKGTTLKQRTSIKKQTPLSPKKKQTSISTLKKKLWTHFSLYVRKRDNYTCFTCGRKGEGGGIHAGHFIPKSVGGIALYFHEENVRAQCYHCNINLGGNQWEYGQRLGKETVDKLMELKKLTTKWTENDYLSRIEHYKKLSTD